MTRRWVELALWVGAIVLAALAGVWGRAAASALSSSTVPAPPWEALGNPAPILVPRSDALVAASEAFVARDPFRLERKPSGVAYSPALEGAPPPPPRPPRPALAVAGILGGPPWEALLEGIPGREGSALVRRGDTLGGLRIRSITRDTVRITGMDTAWALTIRRAWQ
jgi:hypothetical protein